jgi:molybdenum cofactor synthesis domain-containing protein
MRAGILTVSDRAAAGRYEDRAGPVIRELVIARLLADVADYTIVPDEMDLIRQTLVTWSDAHGLDLILTTGGTGFAPRDVTPEATQSVIQREAPGLVFAMLQASLLITPHAMLSRAVAGIRGHTLIINLPGNPKAVRENLESILPALPHALALLCESPDAEAGHQLVAQKR